MSTSSTFWCSTAWLGGPSLHRNVRIETDNGLITAVRAGTSDRGDAVVLSGVTMPGIANAHSHAFQRALRGRTHRGTGTFWTWRDLMYELADRLDPASCYRMARATYGEMLLAGITCVGEFHYVHHQPGGARYANANELGVALADAAADVGMRITLLDTCYLRGGFERPLSPSQHRFSDTEVTSWCDRVDALADIENATTKVGAAIHSVRAVAPADIGVIADFARQRQMVVHAHVSEQLAENEQCRQHTGMSPVGVFAAHGALSELFTAVHATHIDNADRAALGGARATVCACPTTERDLADGIGVMSSLVAAGGVVAIGTDSHALIDPFEEVRGVEMNERVVTQQRGVFDPESLAAMATINGYHALGWNGGHIGVGAVADLVTVGTSSVRMAGCDEAQGISAVMFAAGAADVTHVVVNGRLVVRDGAHCSLDVAAELQSSIRTLTSEG